MDHHPKQIAAVVEDHVHGEQVDPMRRHSRRFSGTLNVWARCACTFAGASTVDFLFHGHRYALTTRLGDEVDA